MSHSPPTLSTATAPAAAALSTRGIWINVVLAALLMTATLPGRTFGLGLITEPLLLDLKLDRVAYSKINLWATLLGAIACLPMGWCIDRFGLRRTSSIILVLLAVVVWQMTMLRSAGLGLFLLVMLTRALGQGALSVASITAVGKSATTGADWKMGIFSVLLSVFFAAAFSAVGAMVTNYGWRLAWGQIGVGLLVLTPLIWFVLREPPRAEKAHHEAEPPVEGATLGVALRTPLFWVAGGASAAFLLVSSGFLLFNEAILAERGFPVKAYHDSQAAAFIFGLGGQILCGWLAQRVALSRLLAVGMLVYAVALVALPLLRTSAHLWTFAAAFGVAGGFVTVIFFAIWSKAYGRAHLGRIQGSAQMITVVASALGPLVFAQSQAWTGSFAPGIYLLAGVVLLSGLAAWKVKMPTLSTSHPMAP